MDKKGNIYVLDEPTTGLHASDIKNIMELLDGKSANDYRQIFAEIEEFCYN